MTVIADAPPPCHPAEILTEIEAEVAAFNREAIELTQEAAILKPLSDKFAIWGEALEKLMKIGLENLSLDQRAELVRGLNEAQAFRKVFEPRLNALLARMEAHRKHEADLRRRLKESGLLFQPDLN
jgi:hypothetical protein